MGMDIISSSGVVFPVADICVVLFADAKKGPLASAVANIKAEWKEEWGELQIDKVDTGVDLAEWFSNLVSSQVKDDYLDDRIVGTVWDLIVEGLGLQGKLPSASFDYWTHSRISGWDVPIEVPCIVFDENGLFETKMTREGKKFAKLIGEQSIKSTTWTIMSV